MSTVRTLMKPNFEERVSELAENLADCQLDDCQQDISHCEECVNGNLYDEVCHRDDCRRDRDYCPDCLQGDKYRSPDIPERD